MSDIPIITSVDEYREKVANSNDRIVLDCFAPWSNPSPHIASSVDDFSSQYPGVKFYRLNTDQLPEIAEELCIQSMPIFFYFKDGELVDCINDTEHTLRVKAAIKKL